MAMNRQIYQTKHIYLVAGMQKETALDVIRNAPIDPIRPIEVVVREKQALRKNDQNALMWAGALKDIAEQAWIDGKQYSAKVWHEHFKREHLPEQYEEGMTKEGYRKWDYLPNGEPVLVGSTTDLLTKGFGIYLEKVYADGANLGVRFRAVGYE